MMQMKGMNCKSTNKDGLDVPFFFDFYLYM